MPDLAEEAYARSKNFGRGALHARSDINAPNKNLFLVCLALFCTVLTGCGSEDSSDSLSSNNVSCSEAYAIVEREGKHAADLASKVTLGGSFEPAITHALRARQAVLLLRSACPDRPDMQEWSYEAEESLTSFINTLKR